MQNTSTPKGLRYMWEHHIKPMLMPIFLVIVMGMPIIRFGNPFQSKSIYGAIGAGLSAGLCLAMPGILKKVGLYEKGIEWCFYAFAGLLGLVWVAVVVF